MITQTIEIKDGGPVTRLSIPLKPGFVILRGRNDCGKSKTLEAVGRLLGGKGEVTKRDGASSGEIEGLGVRISLGKVTRKTGELEALSIEGKLSVADLVDPGIDNPERADAQRIKALLQITGAKADASLFYELLGGQDAFSNLVHPESLKTTDLVELSARIKRDLERLAREEAAIAAKEAAAADAARRMAGEVDTSDLADPAVLQDQHQAAVADLARLQEQRKAAAKQDADLAHARKELARLQGEYVGPTVDQAADALTAAENTEADLITEWNRTKEMFRDLTAAVDEARIRRAAAGQAHQAAVAHHNALAAFSGTLADQQNMPCPSLAEVSEATGSVATFRISIERAAVAREALRQAAEADEHAKLAAAARQKAEWLREKARQTDDVLSEAVASPVLSIVDGRMITPHPTRGKVAYADRSQGTRTRIAIEEAARRIRQLGVEKTAVLAIPQELFQSLDPDNRRIIHNLGVELDVMLLTAEAAEDDLRVEAFGG